MFSRRQLCFLLLCSAGLWAADLQSRDVMIPMRDGVKLHATVWPDPDQTGKLPFLMVRTPYGIGAVKNSIERGFVDLRRDGYIFVYQDIRGRYGSEGQFVMNRPPRDASGSKRSDPKNIDEGTDTYDTIDWLLKNVPDNNG